MIQRLLRPRSRPAKPSPRRTLRAPTCPGKSGWKLPSAAAAAAALPKMLTVPSGFFDAPTVFVGAIGGAKPDSSQLVGYCAPLLGAIGKPLVQRARPESCQPPMTASTPLLALVAIQRPFPNGSSQIQLAFI